MSSSLAEAALAGVEGDPKRQVARAEALWETVGRALEPAPTRPGDLEVSVLDPARLESTGWRARVGFEDGIAETVRWFAAWLGSATGATPPMEATRDPR